MNPLAEILEQIRSRGERITIQRRLVIEVLCSHPGHLSVVEIAQAIPDRHGLSESTVYRILQWLKHLELVSQTDMGETGIVYQLLIQPHHHLICLSCGSVTDLADRYMLPLREMLASDMGFRARIDHMAIYGYCHLCGQKINIASQTPGT